MNARADASEHLLREWCALLCSGVRVPTSPRDPEQGCTELDWAASGAMALTGTPDAPWSALAAATSLAPYAGADLVARCRLLGGGGQLIDLSMRPTVGAFASAVSAESAGNGPHGVYRAGDEWRVHCPELSRDLVVLPPRPPAEFKDGAGC